MKKKVLAYTILTVFLISVFLPQIIFPFIKDHLEADTSEKRILAEMPEFSLDTIEDYPEEFENYWNDHVPFRNLLKKLWGNLNFLLFDASTTDQVTVGKNDGDKSRTWLFFSTTIDSDPMADVRGANSFSQEEMDTIADTIQSNTSLLAEKGIDLYYMLIPNKGNIYPEKLPDSISILDEVSRTEKLYNYLTNEQNIENIVYVKSALLDAKETADVFFRQDTHWNGYGAYVGFKEIMQMAEPELDIYDGVEIVIHPEKKDRGDLIESLNISYPIKGNNVTVKGFLKESRKYKHRSRPAKVQTIETSYNRNAPLDKKLLVVGDSFTINLQQYFSRTYRSVRIIHRDIYNKKILDQYQPDVVIYEAVERFSPSLSKPLA